jgi:hypothetical protein
VKTLKKVLSILVFLPFAVLFPFFAFGLVDLGPEDGFPPGRTIGSLPDTTQERGGIPDIREEIRRGQEFLKDKTAGCTETVIEKRVTAHSRRGRKREKVVFERIVKPNFLLAVEDLTRKRIHAVRMTEKGCATEGFEVVRVRNNGVGSRFEVVYPRNMVVLALRTRVRSGENGHTEVVYTPYSPEIDTWQVRQAGLAYLTRQIELAHKDLRAKNVRLSAFEEFDADRMPTRELSLVLSIIEHIDPVRFKQCKEGQESALVREVLTIIGANTTRAYAYSKSPAGARGLFQFIPRTYKRLQEKYPEAGLMESFVSGCNDHVNAAKASLLLFDSDLSDLPKGWLSEARRSVRSVGTILAAAYNCGARRVGESARVCGDEWTCRLPEETKIYLKKFDVVWGLRKTLDK